MEKYALIVAGGSGTRMGSKIPKQFLLLKDKPLLWYSVSAFVNAFKDIHIILVLPSAFMNNSLLMAGLFEITGNIQTVEGGTTRFQSVYNGLKLVPDDCMVFVHDGVRALLTPALVQSCYHSSLSHGNAIPAISATDTIRLLSETGSEAIDRSKVKLVQTPQTFISTVLKQAYRQEYSESFTDDASVVERMGETIHLVEGELTNIKITYEMDIKIAELMLLKQL